MADEPPANGISLILPGSLVSGGSDNGSFGIGHEEAPADDLLPEPINPARPESGPSPAAPPTDPVEAAPADSMDAALAELQDLPGALGDPALDLPESPENESPMSDAPLATGLGAPPGAGPAPKVERSDLGGEGTPFPPVDDPAPADPVEEPVAETIEPAPPVDASEPTSAVEAIEAAPLNGTPEAPPTNGIPEDPTPAHETEEPAAQADEGEADAEMDQQQPPAAHVEGPGVPEAGAVTPE